MEPLHRVKAHKDVPVRDPRTRFERLFGAKGSRRRDWTVWVRIVLCGAVGLVVIGVIVYVSVRFLGGIKTWKGVSVG